jgi:secreted PhoX family phosphatase
MTDISRRSALALGSTAALTFSLGFWREALATPAVAGKGPYGALGAADRHGVRLPKGFKAKLIGRSDEMVKGTSFVWPRQPDGAACFATEGGGWIYAANSEVNGTGGGAAAIVFSPEGKIQDAYRILGGTKWNCSGGATPWGTWLSGEEFRDGYVWECDPSQPGQGIARKLLGRFAHEAAVVDPATGWVYLTEDNGKGRLYRFRPAVYGDLTEGVLEAAKVNRAGDTVSWVEVSSKRPDRSDTTTPFKRGEGAFFSDGHVYFTTTGDNRVWALNTATNAIEIVYDAKALGSSAPLTDPDCITVHQTSGDIFVGEDTGNLQLVLLADGKRNRIAAPFVELVGHGDGKGWVSEVTGLAFSPDGTRLYLSSQRGTDRRGMTFEITGPFRQ